MLAGRLARVVFACFILMKTPNLRLAALSLAALAACAAHAQSTPQTPEIVVTATRTAQPLTDIVADLSVVDRDTIAEVPYAVMLDWATYRTVDRQRLREAYSPLTALCVMLFLLIATPCLGTVAIVRRESGRWRYAILQFVGLTALAYLVTFGVYQIGSLIP